MVLFVDFALRESIGFTGVLWDWWVVNRCVLMCYFFIKYMVFGWVRESAWFIRILGDFRVEYWWFLMVLKVMKCLIFQGFVEVSIEVVFWVEFGWNASKTLILQGVCGLKRYALPGFRLSVLKCKLRPLMVWKDTIIVQYYSVFLLDPLSELLQLIRCDSPVRYPVKQKYLTRFDVRLR